MLTDSSRRYEPHAHLGNRLYYRPVEIDCWYPADSAGAKHSLPGATHEDFSSLPILATSIRKTDSSALPRYLAFAINWFVII